MLISDDPRARSYAKLEFWRGFKYGVVVMVIIGGTLSFVIHYM